MLAKVQKASTGDVEVLIQMLSRSFDDDPLVNWFVRQDDKRAKGFQNLFKTSLLSLSLPHGEVLKVEGGLGSALWYPPGTSDIGLIKQLLILPDMARVTGLSRLNRLIKLMDRLDKEHPKEKHYYLQFIGVDPVHQRKGYASSLMQPVLDKCDIEGCGAYLENSKEENISFYEKLGFNVTGEMDFGNTSPKVWKMWRDCQ